MIRKKKLQLHNSDLFIILSFFPPRKTKINWISNIRKFRFFFSLVEKKYCHHLYHPSINNKESISLGKFNKKYIHIYIAQLPVLYLNTISFNKKENQVKSNQILFWIEIRIVLYSNRRIYIYIYRFSFLFLV